MWHRVLIHYLRYRNPVSENRFESQLLCFHQIFTNAFAKVVDGCVRLGVSISPKEVREILAPGCNVVQPWLLRGQLGK